MHTFAARLSRFLSRRPYSVLGYSAEDEVWCPTCLRVAAGLVPGLPDTDGKPVQALYAADRTVHEEVCNNCHQKLLDLVPALQPPTQLTIARRVRVPDSTIVKYEPIGLALIDATDRGVVYLNVLDEPCYLSAAEPETLVSPVAATPKPPLIRKRAS